MVVHSVTAAARLADLIPIFHDQQIQLFCTHTTDSMFPRGIEPFIQNHDLYQLTWEQARSIKFHAIITASLGDNLHELTSPIVRIPHGNGYNKTFDQRPATSDVFGLSEDTLKHDGKLVPAAIGLSHSEQFERLAEGCPDAVPRAFIAGDPCYDRLLASLPHRLHYRHAFHLRPGQRLITIASTWREDSLFGLDPLLASRLLSELPYDRYRVALILHPNIWASHSGFQIKAWLAAALRAGLILVPPDEGWQAAVIAADWVLSDYGSLSVYAAAAGRPVLLDKSGQDMIDPRGAIGRLFAVAAALDPSATLEPQLRQAEETRDRTHAVAETWVSSASGRSLRLISDELYRIMNVPPPETEPAVLALEPPKIDNTPPASVWTQIEQVGTNPRELLVHRWPASVTGSAKVGVLIAADRELDHRLAGHADIIWTTTDTLPSSQEQWAAAVFEHRPGVGLTMVHDGRHATLRTRDGGIVSVILDEIDGHGESDLVFAVLAERLRTGTRDLSALSPLTLHLGPDPAHAARASFQAHTH